LSQLFLKNSAFTMKSAYRVRRVTLTCNPKSPTKESVYITDIKLYYDFRYEFIKQILAFV
jgi:hypothetical protein